MVVTRQEALLLFNIRATYDIATLQKIFRQKALECHPDKVKLHTKDDWDTVSATHEFQRLLEAFEYLKKNIDDKEETFDIIKACREENGFTNFIPLSHTQRIDNNLYFFECRCGYDIPAQLDFLSQYEDKAKLMTIRERQKKKRCKNRENIKTLHPPSIPRDAVEMLRLKKHVLNLSIDNERGSENELSSGTPLTNSQPVQETSENANQDDHSCFEDRDKKDEERNKCGIIYITRVPPFMNVTKIRQYMEKFGEVGRIYLTPENPIHRKKRMRMGGSKKPMHLDGWVEFLNKSIAKSVARHLNNTPVGGTKRHNFWRDDLWNIRYLPKFQWHHLLEYHTGQKKAREAKRQAELLQIRRENAHYIDQVERKRRREIITADREKRKLKKLENGRCVADTEPATALQRDPLNI